MQLSVIAPVLLPTEYTAYELILETVSEFVAPHRLESCI